MTTIVTTTTAIKANIALRINCDFWTIEVRFYRDRSARQYRACGVTCPSKNRRVIPCENDVTFVPLGPRARLYITNEKQPSERSECDNGHIVCDWYHATVLG